MPRRRPYAPRSPEKTALYGIVRDNLESFLALARAEYDGSLPAYVERELRAYLGCGIFANGFVRCRCLACGMDLLVAFSCKGRGVCPSCATRRMSNTAAHLVDRVLPDVPIRQYVLSLPFELRRLAAFDARALSAFSRIFVERIFALHGARARAAGIEGPASGAITFVQRFGGSLNLNIHFHVVVADGVFLRGEAGLEFVPWLPPTRAELQRLVEVVARRVDRWLKRKARGSDTRQNEESVLDACARIALSRGEVVTRHDAGKAEATSIPGAGRFAAEHLGFNLHAGVAIRQGDDAGREMLCRYGARPALALDRLRELPDGRIGFIVKYARRGTVRMRVMTPVEFLARLAAIIPPPRYPLVRYHGVFAPNSSWRKLVAPLPRGPSPCVTSGGSGSAPPSKPEGSAQREAAGEPPARRAEAEGGLAMPTDGDSASPGNGGSASTRKPSPARSPQMSGGIIFLRSNVIGLRHWHRLDHGALLASSPRIDWASLLRRTFETDVLQCARCGGRLRPTALITDGGVARSILAAVGRPVEAPPLARARDPTCDADASWGDQAP